MEVYNVLQIDSDSLCEGSYKFLVVSKTYNVKDALIIFANIKTRHSVQLHAWMKDNDLMEAYTFGGGRMSVSIKENIKQLHLFGVSGDYLYTTKILVEEILEKIGLSEGMYDLDLPTNFKVEANLTTLNKELITNN